MKENVNSNPSKVTINDLTVEGAEMSEEDLQLAFGGARTAGEPASCTLANDTDYSR